MHIHSRGGFCWRPARSSSLPDSAFQRQTMSEPVQLLHCDVTVSVQRWEEEWTDISRGTTTPDFQRNGHCEGSHDSEVDPGTDMESDLGSRVKDGGSTIEVLPSLDAPEDCSLDHLRTAKRKPSAVVSCSHDNKVILTSESSDTSESSLSTTEERDCQHEDEFPSRYKESPVSCCRRTLKRNRKVIRKRQDAHPKSAASGWRKPTSRGKPEFTGSQKEQDIRSYNGKQVRKTREVEKSYSKCGTLVSCTQAQNYRIPQ